MDHQRNDSDDRLSTHTAAEVLASFQNFQEFPIKNSGFRNEPNIRRPVDSRSQARQSLHRDPLASDLLFADHSAISKLPDALKGLLNGPSSSTSAPNPPQDLPPMRLDYCRGVVGSGGAMVPGYHPPPTPAASPTFDVPFTPSAPPPPTASREIWRDPQFGGKIKTTSSSTVPDYSWPEVKKEPKPEFKTSFQFVVVNDDKQNARNTVRKHVMKEHRRRERWNQSLQNENEGENGSTTAARKRGRKSGKDLVPQARPSTNPPSSSETSENDSSLPSKRQRNLSSHDGLSASGSSHLEEDQPQELPYTADPLASVGASKVDPFSEFNFHDRDSRIEVNSLLHHFAWVMPSLMDEIVTGSVFHRLGWLYSCVAAHDPSPVHVILGFTLGHMANLRGMVEPVAATEHKAKALELINKRMKSPEKATSDESIGAIVNIAGYELVDCNPKGYAMHMKGLHTMISRKGGIMVLQRNPSLESVVVRLDAIRAYISISAPRYPLYSSIRDLEPIAVNVPSRPYLEIPNQTTPSYAYCTSTLHLLHDLEDILLLINTAATTLTSGSSSSSFAELLRASTLQALRRPTTTFSARLPTSAKCTRLAALVLLDVAVREFFDGPPRRGFFAQQLKTRFLGLDAGTTPWGRSMEMVIAVLLQADRLALERPWRGWYFADGLTITMSIGENDWRKVERELRAYVVVGGFGVQEGSRSSAVWDFAAMGARFLREWEQEEAIF